jgi:hypothetical protein
MTGMGLDCWLAACLAACIPFHWDPAAGCPAVLLLWKLKQLTELKTKQKIYIYIYFHSVNIYNIILVNVIKLSQADQVPNNYQ